MLNVFSRPIRTTGAAVVLSGILMASPFAFTSGASAETVNPSNSLAGNYLAARIAANDKDTQSAVNFYRKAMALDPENNDLKLKAFLVFVANGDFVEGVKLGNALMKAGKAPEIVNLILAVDAMRGKDWPSADKFLTRDWRSSLDRLMSGLVISWVKFGQEDVAGALKIIDGLEGPAWFDLFTQYHGGLIALAGGQTDEAVRRLEAAFANRAGGQSAVKTFTRVAAALAQAHWKAGSKDKAADILKQAIDISPQNPVFERLDADVKSDKGILPEITSAERGAAEVFMNIGTTIDREGGEQFARIYLQLANTLAPKKDVVTVELADLLDRQGLLLRTNALYQSIDEKSPYYRIAQLEVALNLDELEKLKEAREGLDKLLESGPDDLVAHLSYGAVLARHEKFDEAIGIYQRIIKRIPKPERFHWTLFYRLGIAYERTKQWPKAEAAFRKSLTLFPNQPSVLNYLGYSWVDMNVNLKEGLDMIRKAVDLRPNDGYMVDSLGWAYYRLERFEEAVVELERAVELRPADPTINDHLGDAYWRAGRRLEATFQWRHALALDPPKGDIGKIEDKLANGMGDDKKKVGSPEEKKPDNG